MKAQRSSMFGQIGQLRAGLDALERLEKSTAILKMRKMVLPLFSAVFDRGFFILTCNDNIHISLDEFNIRPDLTRDYRASCL